MASNVRQNRILEAYYCLRGLENEVTSDFCLAPIFYTLFYLFELALLLLLLELLVVALELR